MAWYDELNQGLPLGGGAKAYSAEALRAAMQGQKPQAQPKNQKNFWTDQISTGAGIGGALGGAAAGAGIGSLILPGVGTAIGGLIGSVAGGALGSGGGELAENVITGEKDLLKGVGREALLGGAFSAPPLRLARGIGSAVKAAAGQTAETGAQAFSRGLTGGTIAGQTLTGGQRVTSGLLGKAWGVRPGVKIAGQELTPQRANQLQQFIIKDLGVPKTASAEIVFERAVNAQNEVGTAISSAIRSAAPKNFSTKPIAKSLQTKLGGVIGADAKNNQVAKDIVKLVNDAKTPEELWQVRRNIDESLINFGRNPQGATPFAEQIARVARKEINDNLTRIAPDIKALNQRYSQLADVSTLTAGATRSPIGYKIPGFQQTVGGSGAQRIRAGLGTVTGAALGQGRVATPLRAATGGVGALTARQAIGQNVLSPTQPESLEASLAPVPNQFLGSELYSPETAGTQLPQETSPYPRENLLFDIQRDPANADDYIKQYATLQEIFGVPEQKPLSAEASKVISNANSGLTSLAQLESIIQGGGGRVPQGTLIPGRELFGNLGANVLGTAEFDNASKNLADVITRLRTGAALTVSEENFYKSQLPQAFDSPEVIAQKLNVFRDLFSSVANRTGSAGTNIEDILLQQGAF